MVDACDAVGDLSTPHSAMRSACACCARITAGSGNASASRCITDKPETGDEARDATSVRTMMCACADWAAASVPGGGENARAMTPNGWCGVATANAGGDA